MVALALFAILATMSYAILDQSIANAATLGERMERLKALQKTVRVIGEDFMQLTPRPIRNDLGEGFKASLSTDFQSLYAIELTRAGWSNPLVLQRPSLQRVAYRIEEDELVRYHWNVLDRTLANEPKAEVLLDNVDGIAFRFLQNNGEWTEEWPSARNPGPSGWKQRPRAGRTRVATHGRR